MENNLESALDGLETASAYASEVGLDYIADHAAMLYQELAEESPDEHWDEISFEVDEDE